MLIRYRSAAPMNDNTGFHVPIREIRAKVIDTGWNGSENYEKIMPNAGRQPHNH